jgi:hypothetical protein
MSKSEQKQPTKYYIEYDSFEKMYRKDDDCVHVKVHSLPDSQELSVSFQNEENHERVLAHYNEDKVQINSINELITIERRRGSKPLHVHVVEHLGPVVYMKGSEFYEFDELFGNTIYVIFDNHILRIRLEHQRILDCQIDNSNPILSMSDDYTIVKSLIVTPDSDETEEQKKIADFIQCFKVYLVLDIGGGRKVLNLSNLYLMNSSESFSRTNLNFSIKLPEGNLTDFDIWTECTTVGLGTNVSVDGKSTNVYLYIYDGKKDEWDDVPIFLLTDIDRSILATSDSQLSRAESNHFDIVATIYVCPGKDEDDDDFPEIQNFIEALLESNKYNPDQDDSDYGSDYN